METGYDKINYFTMIKEISSQSRITIHVAQFFFFCKDRRRRIILVTLDFFKFLQSQFEIAWFILYTIYIYYHHSDCDLINNLLKIFPIIAITNISIFILIVIFFIFSNQIYACDARRFIIFHKTKFSFYNVPYIKFIDNRNLSVL